MIDAAAIEKEAMQLSAVQRAVLAERLLESISPTSKQIHEAWIKEAEDRMNAYRAGMISSVDGPRAIAEIRERFAK
ncbi:MAG: addiction module protein [Verrucomicrobiales bacterium]